MGFRIMNASKTNSPLGVGPGVAPVAVCDICEGLITEGGMAMYVWKDSDLAEPGFTADFLLVHKGACRKEAEKRIGFADYRDHELGQFLDSVRANTSLTANDK